MHILYSPLHRWAFYPPGVVPAGVTVHVNEENGEIDIDTPSSLQVFIICYASFYDYIFGIPIP